MMILVQNVRYFTWLAIYCDSELTQRHADASLSAWFLCRGRILYFMMSLIRCGRWYSRDSRECHGPACSMTWTSVPEYAEVMPSATAHRVMNWSTADGSTIRSIIETYALIFWRVSLPDELWTHVLNADNWYGDDNAYHKTDDEIRRRLATLSEIYFTLISEASISYDARYLSYYHHICNIRFSDRQPKIFTSKLLQRVYLL